MSILKVDTLQNSVGENLVFENKNLLINGGMNIFQRSTSETGITGSGYQTADRWRLSGSVSGTWTQSRSTDVPSAQGFSYSLKMDCTTADASPAATDTTTIQQRFEGQNLQHLLKGTSSAKKLTLSFWVKSNKTGTYIIEISDQDNTRHICQSYTISSASTWEKKELTFDGDTSGTLDNDNAESLRILWWLSSGSNTNSGTLATSWASTVDANRAVGQVNLADSTSNEWYMTGCQLEVGSKATDFEFEPYSKVLEKCYRYYVKYETDASASRIGVAVADSTGTAHCGFHLVTPLRAVPSMTETDMVLRRAGSDYTISSITSIKPDLPNIPYVSFNVTASSLTSGSPYTIRFNSTSSVLAFDSEL